MLTRSSAAAPTVCIARQRGVILVIAMIMLVAMTLAGVALMRSMDTTNIIAGNLAFRQAATYAGDAGIENAIRWLEANNTTDLHDIGGTGVLRSQGYFASRQEGTTTTISDWAAYWTSNLSASAVGNDASGNVVTCANAVSDSGGNKACYVIERLCNQWGDPVSGIDCSVSQSASTVGGNSKGAGVIALQWNSQVYYRITARVTGPRNTVSFVQAVVAL